MDDSLVRLTDSEILELLEARIVLLEKIKILDKEQKELEKTINNFEVRHANELGNLLLKIFNLKKRIAKNKFEQEPENTEAQNEYSQAEGDEREYKNTLSDASETASQKIDKKQAQEFKKAIRKITLLIHPDKVNEKFKETAEELFFRLKNAEKLNDLDAINAILNHIEGGLRIPLKNEVFSEKEVMVSEIKYLRYRVAEIITVINNLRESEVYLTISEIKDWGAYFTATKATLEIELANLINQCA